MKIKMICIGKVQSQQVSTLVDYYAGRIPHYYPFELQSIADVKQARDADRQKQLEGEKILAEIAPGDFVILFDERGREYTSRDFSTLLERKSIEVARKLIFVIGGPYGFSKDVYNRADSMMSLSKMTFPHELARLFAVEQIYRAGTISRGEPYHHD